MTTGADYTHLGEALASSFTVHLVDRRGRGRSGPQGAGYSIDKECEDLLAVMDTTGARNVFGHSGPGSGCFGQWFDPVGLGAAPF